jgi:MoxR-like ATPase
MNALEALENDIQQDLGATVFGQHELVRALLVAVIARGHVLLEGPPGLGKTLLAKSLARALCGRFTRVQGTADLMPADIIGTHVFDEASAKFTLHPGPVFTELLLVDEINRASPKTQSALLQAMEERQVTIDRQTYRLPAEFTVVATENPHEFEGTFPLPESQLDRFMMRIEVGYPSGADERRVLERYGALAGTDGAATPAPAQGRVTAETMAAARECADQVHVSSAILDYILALAQASRTHAQVALGLSTRGALAMLRAARVQAGLRGGKFVTPDDVKRVARWVVPHRLALKPEALLETLDSRDLTTALLERVAVPR